ncbi:MAG TPA: AtpZ/AtpI family protein [Dehalococcoidia bacterium]|nr:AtpZ/AtpI family protein [Dehalococcoidia bacterium]
MRQFRLVVMERWVWALRFIGIGWYVALCIVLGALLGNWLDHKLHTTPWLAIGGIILGTFFAFFGLYQMVQPWMNKKDKQ